MYLILWYLILMITISVISASQYHIQSEKDVGSDPTTTFSSGDFFDYQTNNGQMRKEKVLPNGVVIGQYGWWDQDGILHGYKYMADQLGYRIVGPIDQPTGLIDQPTKTKTLTTTNHDWNFSNRAKSLLQRRTENEFGESQIINMQPLFKNSGLVEETLFNHAVKEQLDIGSRKRGGRRMYVVKRRRNSSSHSLTDPHLNYITSKSFHREEVDQNGVRYGEFGHIDPFGIRRVVDYKTSAGRPQGEGEVRIQRKKENDFVGKNSVFILDQENRWRRHP